MPMPMRLFDLSSLIRGGMVKNLRPRRVRVRLTLLYGALFVASGAVLLAITYILVSNSSTRAYFQLNQNGVPVESPADDLSDPVRPPLGSGGSGAPDDNVAEAFGEELARQQGAVLDSLVVQSGIALAIMTVISIALGWVVAGRVLRPLRTMTTTIQQISARNVNERLAITGPADELKDLADTVDGLLGRLEAALDSHKRFVANAAHELRTPLTLEHALLEESIIDRDATVESYRAQFERLLTIRKHQGRLLESLLTLSTSERGLDHSEPLDLSEIAEQVLANSRPEMERRGLRIESAIEPSGSVGTLGDFALVERLVANLLDNAMDYNVPEGLVQISTGIVAGRAVVRVENTGTEIPPGKINLLFEPFQRLRRTAGDGHHGLGLSIVRAIATAHGAGLVARARPGGGLVVEAAFPLNAERPARQSHHWGPVRLPAGDGTGSFLVRLPKGLDGAGAPELPKGEEIGSSAAR
jgi:signal transduction histidine kinase